MTVNVEIGELFKTWVPSTNMMIDSMQKSENTKCSKHGVHPPDVVMDWYEEEWKYVRRPAANLIISLVCSGDRFLRTWPDKILQA